MADLTNFEFAVLREAFMNGGTVFAYGDGMMEDAVNLTRQGMLNRAGTTFHLTEKGKRAIADEARKYGA